MAANSTVTLVISTQEGKVSELVGSATAPHESVRRLVNFLDGALIGNRYASIDAHTSTSAPVAASGTFTCTYASLTAADTVTIGSVVLTCSSSTTDATNFKKFTDGPTTCANLATCINTNTVLNKIMSAAVTTGATGVVTVTMYEKGVAANQIPIASSAAGFAVSGTGFLTSGAGGANTAAATYRLGL